MPTNSKGILTNMDEKINNGIIGLRPGTYAIIVDGRQVDTAHGDPLAAEAQRAEWLEAIADDPAVEAYANTAIEDIPDAYWKNGHITPLKPGRKPDGSRLEDWLGYGDCVICGATGYIAGDHGWMCDGCYNGTQEADESFGLDEMRRSDDGDIPFDREMYPLKRRCSKPSYLDGDCGLEARGF